METWQDFLRFIIAGRGSFTVQSARTGRVLRFSCAPWDAKAGPSVKLVAMPETASLEESDEAFVPPKKDAVGFVTLDAPDRFKTFVVSSVHAAAQEALKWVWSHGGAGSWPPPRCVVMHDGRCAKCRRVLTDSLSKARGIGPDCLKKLDARDASTTPRVPGVPAARALRNAVNSYLDHMEDVAVKHHGHDAFDHFDD